MSYSTKVLDHYENPRNVGSFDKSDDSVGTGMVGAPACGDVMKLQIKVNESGVIEDARFKTYGCGSAIASSSLVTEWVKGKTLDEALTIRNTQIAEELALPPVKVHCSILAEDAIKAAVQNYKEKHSVPPRRRRTENEYGPPRSAARFPSGHAGGPAEPDPWHRDGAISVSCVAGGASAPWKNNMSVTLTQKAANHIGRYLQKRGKGIGLRLGVRTTGCSGMAYKLEYVDEAAPEDMVFESFGVNVYVDPKSLAYLDGTELDYAREGLNEGFKFRNPNEKATCGCGESFTV